MKGIEMTENIIAAFDTFQIADLDDDMVGMCVALVNWMKVLRQENPDTVFPETEAPNNFYKLDPHQPKMELRKNCRKMLAHSTKFQKEEEFEIKLVNIYVTLLATTYVYHMPTVAMVNAGKETKEFTRDDAKTMLLNDNMSPNWLKEPSGKDFTAIML